MAQELQLIDFVTRGIGRLPSLGRVPNVVRYFSVFLQVLQDNQTALLQEVNAFLTWESQAPTFDFVLDFVGVQVFGLERPTGMSNDLYRFYIQAASLAMQARAVRPGVERLVEFLSQGQSFELKFLVPELVRVDFFNLELDQTQRDLYRALLLRAIKSTDGLELQFLAGSSFFSWDTDELGWDEGIWSP